MTAYILLTSEDIFKSIQNKDPRVLHSFYIVKPGKCCIERNSKVIEI